MSLGNTLKHQGMERAARSSNPEWWAFMYAAGIEVAKRQEFFLSDDLDRIKWDRDGPSTRENRALGPLMRELEKAGVCQPTERFVLSVQPQNHRCPRRVWRSLIYNKTAGERERG